MTNSKETNIKHYMDALERIEAKASHKIVRPYFGRVREDGFVNVLNSYGTDKDTTEHYVYEPEPEVPDEVLVSFYESNGLFKKIIDTPAEEAIKHGFELKDMTDDKITDFYTQALDELDWEETAMTCIKWARLFGGSIAVMLINDGRKLEEPLNWRSIQSIDDIRVYDRSLVMPDYASINNYDPRNPFDTRGSRLGEPEFYHVYSRYGNFRVHESRCLVFRNGILPENTRISTYQMWGVPEYLSIHRAVRDAELAHSSGPKMLDKSVQPIYKMSNLSQVLATEGGEGDVLRRLNLIDMSRGMLNSIVVDSEGEDYDFKTFQFSGVSDVIESACNYLSALTSIPQTILFGRSPAGMNSTGLSDLENYYNFVERIQKRMLRSNLRYLLSIIFHAGLHTGEVDEIPAINVQFNPLWSMSDTEQADLDLKKAQIQSTKAQTASIYMQSQVLDPSEVRRKLADSDEFDVETMLDEYDDEDLFPDMEEGKDAPEMTGDMPNQPQGENSEKGVSNIPTEENKPEKGVSDNVQSEAEYEPEVSIEEHNSEQTNEKAPISAPDATKLPEDMEEEDKENLEKTAKKDSRYDGITKEDVKDLASLRAFIISKEKKRSDGGEGSGNFNHEGREGEVGGSAPSDGTPATTDSAKAQGRAMFKMTKRRFNDKVNDLMSYKDDDEREKALGEVRKMIDDLPSGSVVTDRDGHKWTKREDNKWENKEEFFLYNSEDMSYEFDWSEEERAKVTKVAMTEEAKAKDLERYEKTNWRKSDKTWKEIGSLGEQTEIKLRKLDLDHCGNGFELVGTDGRTYIKTDEGWIDSETYRDADMRKLKAPTFRGDFFDVNFGMNGISAHECQKMREIYDNMPEEMKPLYEKVFRETEFKPALEGCSHFSPTTKEIYFDRNSNAETIVHECGHKIDEGAVNVDVERYGVKRTITKASILMDFYGNETEQRQEDFEAMAKWAGYTTNGEGWFSGQYNDDENEHATSARLGVTMALDRKYGEIPGYDCVSDAISALTFDSCGESYISGGHSKSYWMNPYGANFASNRSTEYWANYCQLKACGYTDALEMLKTVSPNMYAAAERTYKEAFGNG